MYQMKITNQEVFTEQWTKTFSQIYPTFDEFYADYNEIDLKAIPFPAEGDSQEGGEEKALKTIYYILMGEYANSAISNLSVDQFKIRLFTIVMSHGP